MQRSMQADTIKNYESTKDLEHLMEVKYALHKSAVYHEFLVCLLKGLPNDWESETGSDFVSKCPTVCPRV